jgi:hypothetical protein
MKRFAIVLSLTIALLMASAFVASADCVPAAGTAGDDIITCTGVSMPPVGLPTVDGLAGNDTVAITGTLAGNVVGGADDDTITVNGDMYGGILGDTVDTDPTGGSDTITITGTLTGDIAGGWDDDTITVDGTMTGWLFGDLGGSDAIGGNDTIIINGTLDGNVVGDSGAIQLATGDDVIIINGTITGSVVGDTVQLNRALTNASNTYILRDGAHGGPDNTLTMVGSFSYDALIFQFTVNSEVDDLALSAQIAAADPFNGSIAFQGQTFSWLMFDDLINALTRNYGANIPNVPNSPNVPIVVTFDAFQPLRDGRLNGADHAAPVAVYLVDYGSGQVGLHLYDTATGVLLLEVTPELIAATDGVSSNTLIAEGAGVVVYRLADGTFYVGAPMANGKQYILTFDQLSASTAYSSTEVE